VKFVLVKDFFAEGNGKDIVAGVGKHRHGFGERLCVLGRNVQFADD